MGSHAQPGTPDLSALSPHLQKEWHFNDNLLLGGKVVKPQGHFRAKRECNKGPEGKPHIFTTVQHKTNGSNCP